MDTTDKFLESVFMDTMSLQGQLMGLSGAVNILFAAVIGFLIIGIYILTTSRGHKDMSLIQSIPVLSILMSVIMRIDASKAVLFFGIFGILSIVRYRSDLTDQKGIAFILFAVIMGLLSGVGSFLLAVISFFILSAAIIVIRFAFITGRYHHAVITFSGQCTIEQLYKKTHQILGTKSLDFEIADYVDKINKQEKNDVEIDFVIRTKTTIEMIQIFTVLQTEAHAVSLKAEIKSGT